MENKNGQIFLAHKSLELLETDLLKVLPDSFDKNELYEYIALDLQTSKLTIYYILKGARYSEQIHRLLADYLLVKRIISNDQNNHYTPTFEIYKKRYLNDNIKLEFLNKRDKVK